MIRPRDVDALIDALSNATSIQSNGGHGDQPFVRVYFAKAGDQDAFYSLITEALTEAGEAS